MTPNPPRPSGVETAAIVSPARTYLPRIIYGDRGRDPDPVRDPENGHPGDP